MPIHFTPFPYDVPFTLDSIGNHWEQEPVRRPEGFPLYHWLQTESGCGVVKLDNMRFELEPGDGVLIAPQIPHFYRRKGNEWITAFATFGGNLADHTDRIVGNEPFILVKASQAGYYASWISRILKSYLAQQLTAAELSSECYDFLLHFTNIYQLCVLHVNPLYQQYVAPIIKEIETSYSEALSVEALAMLVYVSPQYLNRLFRRFVGCSVYTFLTNFRINKAKELLVGNLNLEIQQLYYRVGYSNVSHFIAAFKKYTGYTPLEFRKMYGMVQL